MTEKKSKVKILLKKIKNAGTIKEVNTHSKELSDAILKMVDERGETIADLASNLTFCYKLFIQYQFENKNIPDILYKSTNKYIKAAKEFYHLPTIRGLSECLKAYMENYETQRRRKYE